MRGGGDRREGGARRMKRHIVNALLAAALVAAWTFTLAVREDRTRRNRSFMPEMSYSLTLEARAKRPLSRVRTVAPRDAVYGRRASRGGALLRRKVILKTPRLSRGKRGVSARAGNLTRRFCSSAEPPCSITRFARRASGLGTVCDQSGFASRFWATHRRWPMAGYSTSSPSARGTCPATRPRYRGRTAGRPRFMSGPCSNRRPRGRP